MKHYIAAMLCSISLTACVQEIGEFTDHESPRLVVNTLITAGADNQQLRIHQTGMTHVETVEGAEIRLAVNDRELFRTLTAGEDSLVIGHNDLKPGDVVSLSAQKDEMHATASALVYEPIVITGLDTMMVNVKKYRGASHLTPHTRYLVHLRLPETDAPEVRHFRVEVAKEIRTTASMEQDAQSGSLVITSLKTEDDHSLFSYSHDPALCETENADQSDFALELDWLAGVENRYHVFRSTFFRDGNYTLRLDLPRDVWFSKDGGWAQYVLIRVYAIPQIEYHYLQALSAAKYYERDVISNGEPMIPTNVTGGAGIFCVESVAEISFHEDHFTIPFASSFSPKP